MKHLEDDINLLIARIEDHCAEDGSLALMDFDRLDVDVIIDALILYKEMNYTNG